MIPPSLLLAGGALAATLPPVERALDPGTPVHIASTCGVVSLIGWDLDRVLLAAEVEDRVRDVGVRQTRQGLRVAVRAPGGGEERCAWLALRVPRDAVVTVLTDSADLEASQLSGELSFHTISGDLDAVGRLRRLSAVSVGGAVDLLLGETEVTVQTDWGPVDIRAGRGARVDAATVSAPLYVASPAIERLQIASDSGDLRYVGGLLSGGRIAAETRAGAIRGELSPDISAAVRLESFAGALESDFEPDREEPGLLDMGSSMSLVTGGGEGSVWFSSLSGDVELRKR